MDYNGLKLLETYLPYVIKEKEDLLPTLFLSGACCMIDQKKDFPI